MVAQSEWEYTYRWADGLDVDALEARDQALEDHMRNFGGDSCSVDFEHPYRWDQILSASSPAEQIQLLEHNMEALEAAVNSSGGCTMEFPFRWSQFWEALLAGEAWAIGIAEENDRAIEFRFGRCSCGAAAFALHWDAAIADGAFAGYEFDAATSIGSESDPGRIRVFSVTGSGSFNMDVYVNEIIFESYSITEAGYLTTANVPYTAGDFFRVEFSAVSGITDAEIYFFFDGPEADVDEIIELTPVYP